MSAEQLRERIHGLRWTLLELDHAISELDHERIDHLSNVVNATSVEIQVSTVSLFGRVHAEQRRRVARRHLEVA